MSMIAFGDKLSSQLRNIASRESRAWEETIIKGKNGGLVTNATGGLHYDDYKELTDEVVRAREFDFVGNLYRTKSAAIKNVAIGKTQISINDMNSFGPAEVSMNVSNRESEQTNYDHKIIPLPLFHKDFEIPWRQEGFSYKEADGRQEAMFQVMATRDTVLMNGAANITLNGEQLWGYTNHPATIKKAGGISDWAAVANKAVVYDEFCGLVSSLALTGRSMMPKSIDVFVATDVYTTLDRKTGVQSSGTNATNQQEILGHSMVRSVQPHPDLPAGAVLLIDASPMTSDIVQVSDLRAIPWQRANELESIRITVLAGAVARIKTDRAGKTGILYATK